MANLILIRYKGKREGKKGKKDKKAAYIAPQKKQQQKLDDLKGTSCFFSEDKGHGFIWFAVNLISVPRHTWWIDSNVTTHISVFI